MRGLTLHQPWDLPMFDGRKPVENRKWAPPPSIIGERISLHAGKTYDYEGAEFIKRVLQLETLPSTPHSVIGATTTVVGWIRLGAREGTGEVIVRSSSDMPINDHLVALRSPWLFGPYAWVLRDTVKLAKPIPCRGAQGLWTVPPEIELRVLEQERLARAA